MIEVAVIHIHIATAFEHTYRGSSGSVHILLLAGVWIASHSKNGRDWVHRDDDYDGMGVCAELHARIMAFRG